MTKGRILRKVTILHIKIFSMCEYFFIIAFSYFYRSIPSMIPVEWKKSKLGKALCSFFQIPQVDAREQLINGADKILKNKNKV